MLKSNPFKIFLLRKEELWLGLVSFLVLVSMNALTICSHWEAYTKGAHGGFWTIFTRNFGMSGYDCWSWITVSGMRIHFETVRHPLYLTFLYPMYQLDHWLIEETHFNWAVFMIAAVLIFSAFYSVVFMYRILREVIGIGRGEATLLVAMLFSFGHVMIPAMVPDHFIISMMLLTMTLYVAGKKLQKGRQMGMWQSMLLLFFTTGMATSNGMKTLIANWWVNGRHVFRPRFVLVAVVFPLLALLTIQRCQYETLEVPQKAVVAHIEEVNAKKMTAKKQHEEDRRQAWRTSHDMSHAGQGLFFLMDFETPRLPILVENFLGESILLHSEHALQDVFKQRPIVVRYTHWWHYALVLVVAALLLAGIVLSRQKRFMRMLLCWLGFDITLHLILGFAINEVYIMASGWIFIIPIAIAYLSQHIGKRWHTPFWALLLFITMYLWTYNMHLVVDHLL